MESRLTYLLPMLIVTLLSSFNAHAQSWKKTMSEADKAYREGNFTLADSLYELGNLQGANGALSAYNKGDALYREGDLEGAAKAFKESIDLSGDANDRAEGYHNLGNALLQQQDAQGAVDAFKNALRQNPTDEDARHNLAMAMQMLQQQQQQQQQNQDQNQDQGDQDQEQEQEQGDENQEQEGGDQNQGDQEKDQEQGDQNQEQNQEKGDEEKEGEQQAIPYQLSKEEAERMLDALNQKEKEIQQNLKKEKNAGKRKKIEKDW